MIRNIAALQQMENLASRVNESSSKHAHVHVNSDFDVQIKVLSWREFMNLEAGELHCTVCRIVELAREKFFDELCTRFGVFPKQSSSRECSLLTRSFSQRNGLVIEHTISEVELGVLRNLSDGMVQRLAEIHGLVPSKIVRRTHSLETLNVKEFLARVNQEALDVYGLYLGDSDIQSKYAELMLKKNSAMEKTVEFINNDLAQASINVRVPVENQRGDHPHFSEVMSLELITTLLIYRLPLISQAERNNIRLKLYIQDHGLIEYQVHSEIDFWFGLIAYRFSPVDQADAPEIIAIRGTQRKHTLPGFFASMISVWHPLGPGGNALKGSGAKKLIESIQREGKKIILTGHSMGAEIAVALHKVVEKWVERTYSFNNPGRNKHLMDLTPAARVHHFINDSDPVSYLGDFRDGHVSMIYSTETPIPPTMRESLAQASNIILNNHCMSQTLGKRSWMAVSMRPGAVLGNVNPLWGFLHRFGGNVLYGPWKMVALVMAAVLPFFQKIISWTVEGFNKVSTSIAQSLNRLPRLNGNLYRPNMNAASS